MARLVSVNVGLPREIAWRGKTVFTSVWKAPVPVTQKSCAWPSARTPATSLLTSDARGLGWSFVAVRPDTGNGLATYSGISTLALIAYAAGTAHHRPHRRGPTTTTETA